MSTALQIADGECPQCGANEMPSGYPGGRTFAHHWHYDCKENPLS